MREEQTQGPHLSPDTLFTSSLEAWADGIQHPNSDAKQCFLEEVVHYKALSDTEHEFLVVCARHPSSFQIYLGVDRGAEARAAAMQVLSEVGLSSSLAPSMQYLSSLMGLGSWPSYSSDEPTGTSQCLAHDTVQVSHDGTPAPILAHYGPSVALSTVSFASFPNAAGNEERPRPSLLHLSILLLTIHKHFPCFSLLRYQCCFFSRATCLALIDHFGGMETQHTEGRRAATWRGVHVGLWSAMPSALNSALPSLSEYPVPLGPDGLLAVCNVVMHYRAITEERAVDMREIRYAYPICRERFAIWLTLSL
jgi:hypothetical protein